MNFKHLSRPTSPLPSVTTLLPPQLQIYSHPQTIGYVVKEENETKVNHLSFKNTIGYVVKEENETKVSRFSFKNTIGYVVKEENETKVSRFSFKSLKTLLVMSVRRK
jgi:hypothetical protein